MTQSDTDAIDTGFVRGHFPALESGWIFLDNAGGSQILRGAVDRISEFLLERNVQIGGSYAVSKAAADALWQGREAGRLLTNAKLPEEIVFGPSTTVLMQTLVAAMRGQFHPGDEVVVSTADHESNIGPWERLREFGVTLRYWPLDRDSRQLRLEDLDAVMSERTRLVCVHHVSNILGRINPIKDIAAFVHARGARIFVDGVAYAPHRAIDVRDWDVDYYAFSLYKCFGPHMAILYGKYDLLRGLDGLYHYFYGRERVPGKLEPGNPNYELAYSTVALTDYITRLGSREGAEDTSRARLEAGFRAITAQENRLTARLLAHLRACPDIHVVGADRQDNSSSRVPTIAFRIAGRNSAEFVRAIDDHGIAIRHGDFHSRRLVEELGEDHEGGVIRVSAVHYNTLDEIDRLIAAIDAVRAGAEA